MEIKFLSIKKIESNPDVSRNSYEAAKRMWKDVKVDYITSRHIGFTATDKLYNTKHSIIYFSERKFPKSWNCDCRWHTLKGKFCKHILAVFLRLNKDPFFLKTIKKTPL
ncbi:MAG: SWIM zinc finger family protein [Nanoarchaeota archaeon]|nr:SWIM zinc finger family protein [Nanoarchaeota archaeon]